MTILQIKNKIKQFQVVKCDMYHEKIKLNNKTSQPILNTTSNDFSYERMSLCAKNKRSERLGCAHSSSNNSFINLIEELKIENQEIDSLKKRISDSILQVYSLDHIKGELEKELVISLSQNSLKNKSIIIQEKLTDSILTHRKIMEELKLLKDRLILRLEKL
ncbi:MAG: hypothetical protein V3V28_04825 [Polaribacter sp.]|uniref:hypothetical protein n=1 Tax=Polaribacter sp. TaxID=1920175 RepID=UPI002F353181